MPNPGNQRASAQSAVRREDPETRARRREAGRLGGLHGPRRPRPPPPPAPATRRPAPITPEAG